MSRIILQPSGNKDARNHYDDTIKNPVPLKLIAEYVSPTEYNDLLQIYPNESCFVWGVTPGGNNLTKWNKINSGDVTLLSKDGAIYASCVATYKLHNKLLAEKLWEYNNKGETWEYIYFVDEVQNLHIPYIDFNRTVGYEENYVIQGFNVLDEEKSQKILAMFDLDSDTYSEEITTEEFGQLINKLEQVTNTEQEIKSNIRKEQGYLKRLLFGRKTIAKCGICNHEFPVAFLVTAHIKKRALCSTKERLDSKVVMPMCKFGCDDMFEKGYISVKNGTVIDLRKTPTSKFLKSMLQNVNGNQCAYYKNETKNYFEWHLNHHE